MDEFRSRLPHEPYRPKPRRAGVLDPERRSQAPRALLDLDQRPAVEGWNMLKVLQLIPTLDRSGAEKQMVMLAKGLPRDRFRVEVAALTRSGPLEAELRDAGIPVTVIGKPLKVDPIAMARLARFLKAGSFDVVQTWIFAANAYGRVASRLADVPVVVVAEMAVDLWKGRCERWVDRKLATWCDRLVGNSHAVVEFYRGLGVPEDRLAM